MEGLTKTGTALNQLSILTLWTCDCRFIWFINLFCMFTFRVVAASDKHTEAALSQG
ncbi:hypothetical protein M987_00697 [Enterobacter soli ATCC BAA-2102]|nr:hypothetical protein M987_00697 [Enterobacter soli ATCC BAA-2102]